MQNVAATDNTIKIHPHPQDYRVAITHDKASFKQAVEDGYKLVILKTSPEFKRNLKDMFGHAVRTLPVCKNDKYIAADVLGEPDNLEYKYTAGEKHADENDPYGLNQEARDTFEELSVLFHEIAKTEESRFALHKYFKADTDSKGDGMHAHHTVMNVTLFDKGTVWTSPNGELLHVDEGDIVFIEAGFRHGSPPYRLDARVSGVFEDRQKPWLKKVMLA